MPPGGFDTAFDTESDAVPTVGGADALTLVDGRTFVISQRSGDLGGQTHGVVVDDRRHLSRYRLQVEGAMLETLASTTPNPLSAVIVQRVVDPAGAPVVVPGGAASLDRRWHARAHRGAPDLVGSCCRSTST